MLLTSRDTGRGVIPKGWPMRTLAPSAAAAREAHEEAGLVGEIAGEEPVGSFRYAKRLKNGKEATCLVTVFLLKVQRQLETWPECRQRRTKWFDISGAAAAVDELELQDILRRLAAPS